jgi:hypothetical protein
MRTWLVITIAVICLVSTSIGAGIVSASTDVNLRVGMPETPLPETRATPAPTLDEPSTTTTPTETPQPTEKPYTTSATPQVLHFNGVTVLHNRVPLLDLGYEPRRYYLVPGASFPGIRGQTVEQATVLIANSFPQLQVRAVRIGDPVAYEVRRDRITLQYDPFTRRVVSARIG